MGLFRILVKGAISVACPPLAPYMVGSELVQHTIETVTKDDDGKVTRTGKNLGKIANLALVSFDVDKGD